MEGSTIRWETVEVFGVRGMAEVAGSALRSADIPFRITADDGGPALQLPVSFRSRGAELQVPAEDLEDARALLSGEQMTVEAMDAAEASLTLPDEPEAQERVLQRDHLLSIGRVLVALAVVALIVSLLTNLV